MMIERNKSLRTLNTFGIDTTSTWYADYHSVDELLAVLQQRDQLSEDSQKPCRILHIGGGSNLLFLRDYEGLVLHNAINTVEVVSESDQDVVIRVGGGMVFDDLIQYVLNKGWYGIENLSIVPGEVGASAVQNIGAYGVEAKDSIELIELVDLQTGQARRMTNSEAQYAYRYSLLKSPELWGKYAVTYVHFRLQKHFEPRIEYGGLRSAYESSLSEVELQSLKLLSDKAACDEQQMKALALKLRDVIIAMRNGKLPDPKVLGNAGSFFMNPVISRADFLKIKNEYPEVPSYDVDPEHVKVPAGWLIEKCGWKGKSLGRAGVYEKQALVLVNRGGAVGADIVALSDAIRKDVMSVFGVDIHPEVNFIS